MPSTSTSLMERLKTGRDDEAWQRLVELYAPLIRHTLRAAAIQPADEEDLLQEVLSVVVRDLPAFRHNGRSGAFRAWLRGIALNRLREFWRTRRRTPETCDESGGLDALEAPDNPHQRLWDEEHDGYVVRRLFELIEPQFERSSRLAFRRVVIDGRKPAEVAAELGVSVNAVLLAKSRI